MESLCFITDSEQQLVVCELLKVGGVNVRPAYVDNIPAYWGNLHAMIEKRLKAGFATLHRPVIYFSYSFRVPVLQKNEAFWSFVISLGGSDAILREARYLMGDDRRCERNWCMGFLRTKNEPVEFFDCVVEGFMPDAPKGRIINCETDTIFMPLGKNRTLGEMKKSEYEDWLLMASRKSPVVGFLDWWQKVHD